MGRVGLYLGGKCPPNMEAYLDSLLFDFNFNNVDIITVKNCSIPPWLVNDNRVTIRRCAVDTGEGIDIVWRTTKATRQYISEYSPKTIRQITQPRWHAPGVILGALGSDVRIETRASASMFTEHRTADHRFRSFAANNVLGRSVFFSDTLYTPKYGAVDTPWWSTTETVIEERKINQDRFSADTEPLQDLFDQSTQRVISVGRVSKRKGMDLLLKVAKHLPEWEFSIVGPIRDQDLATSLNKQKNIILYGEVPYIDMPRVYTAADILLSVSRLEWGGISRAMLEAHAVELPVVALDIEDAAEVADIVVPESSAAIVGGLKNVFK
jgi:glycosyltransferase involved in cell wall biosynthesis